MIKRKISFTLNGQFKEFEISPNEKLLTLLRRNGYKGTKHGCFEGSCGSCTVILNGNAIASCLLFAFQANGSVIETIEGVNSKNEPHEIQKALINEGAIQCGYCTPGMILSAKAMFDENPVPTEDYIKVQMDGNLCRCTGYEKIWTAMKKISDKHRKSKP